MEQIKSILAGISAVSAYAGHEYSHQVLGSGAIQEVTVALSAFAFLGIVLQEFAIEGEFDEELLPVVAIGAASFGIAHEITHGNLGGGILELGLSNTSYWLAGVAGVGSLVHNYFADEYEQ